MKIFKVLFGLIIVIIGLTPITMFGSLIFMTKFEWLMMLRNLPDCVLYAIVISIIISSIYFLFIGIKIIKKYDKLEFHNNYVD